MQQQPLPPSKWNSNSAFNATLNGNIDLWTNYTHSIYSWYLLMCAHLVLLAISPQLQIHRHTFICTINSDLCFIFCFFFIHSFLTSVLIHCYALAHVYIWPVPYVWWACIRNWIWSRFKTKRICHWNAFAHKSYNCSIFESMPCVCAFVRSFVLSNEMRAFDVVSKTMINLYFFLEDSNIFFSDVSCRKWWNWPQLMPTVSSPL